MLAAFPSILGTAGGFTGAPATATAGPTTQGGQAVSIGGIQTGGSAGGIPLWALLAGLGLAALFVLRRR